MILALGSDNSVVLDGLSDIQTGAYINGATVTASVLNMDGTAVDGASGLPLSYVLGSNGKYQGTVPASVSLAIQDYFVDVVAVNMDGSQRTFRETVQGQWAE